MLEMLIIMMNRCGTLHAPPYKLDGAFLFSWIPCASRRSNPNAVIKQNMRLSTIPKEK